MDPVYYFTSLVYNVSSLAIIRIDSTTRLTRLSTSAQKSLVLCSLSKYAKHEPKNLLSAQSLFPLVLLFIIQEWCQSVVFAPFAALPFCLQAYRHARFLSILPTF